LLGDEDRLRLLALCSEEELSVGELATLLKESQPQLTKKSQPLREAGLLLARRDGARTLLKAAPVDNAVLAVAVEEGRALCAADGSLSRIASVLAAREELSRRTFDAPPSDGPVVVDGVQLLPFLPMMRTLLPRCRLAVDVGTGDGALLPLLSPLYEHVVALDRSAARLARCALRIEALGLHNVRLRQSAVDDPELFEEIQRQDGADLVVIARVLRHLAKPADAVQAAARLVRRGGYLIIIDALPHDDESVREHGDVWLGFEPQKLQWFLEGADLELRALELLPTNESPHLHIAVGVKPSTSQ
jgi:ArsR family transcriptional regulator